MNEGTTARCDYVFPSGEKCQDTLGHEEYYLNCGHLPPKVESAEPYGRLGQPVIVPAPRRTSHLARMSALTFAVLAAVGMGSGSADLAPLPPRPERDPEPPLPEKERLRRSGSYGRGGSQPMARAFHYNSEPGKHHTMVDDFNAIMEGERNAKRLREAEEKRGRKARKRLGK